MLRISFDHDRALQAELDLVREWLSHRPHPGHSSWFEHCTKNGWTFEEMMRGFDGWKRDRAVTIDHEPATPGEAPRQIKARHRVPG